MCVYSQGTRQEKNTCSFLDVCVFTREDKRIRSCINVRVITSDEFIHTRRKKVYAQDKYWSQVKIYVVVAF